MMSYDFIFNGAWFLVPLILVAGQAEESSSIRGRILRSHVPIQVAPKVDGKLGIFCFPGLQRNFPGTLFSSVKVRVSLEPGEFDVFPGSNEQEVLSAYTKSLLRWGFEFRSRASQGPKFSLSPFQNTCLGVLSDLDYIIALRSHNIDPERLMLFLAGIVCFFGAESIATSLFCNCVLGSMFACLGSALLAAFFISRMMPLIAGMSVLFCGLVVTTAMLKTTASRGLELLKNPSIVLYILATTAATVGLIRYKKPHGDPRVRTAFLWALQVLGLFSIFFSITLKKFAFALDAGLLAMKHVVYPRIANLLSWFTRRWRMRFHQSQDRLSDEEFILSGIQETKEGLEKLRLSCSAPGVAWWQILSRLEEKDRFLAFMCTGAHVTETEIQSHYDEFVAGGNGIEPISRAEISSDVQISAEKSRGFQEGTSDFSKPDEKYTHTAVVATKAERQNVLRSISVACQSFWAGLQEEIFSELRRTSS